MGEQGWRLCKAACRRDRRALVCPALRQAVLLVACGGPVPALAQTIPPPPAASQVTPRSLAPAEPAQAPSITIEAAPPQTPAGAERLVIRPGSVTLEGATPAQRDRVADVVSGLIGRSVSVADVYAAAGAIERRFAAAGYPLVRVVVPPQHLTDGSKVQLVFIDGFIEAVDLSNAPPRLRRPLRHILDPLIGRRGLTLASLERKLSLADDLSGATIRSTLGAGATPGGTRLIIQARHQLLSGSITFDNRQSPAFRGRNTTLQLSLASPFGSGEQLYGYVSADPFYGLGDTFAHDAPRRTYGGGVILPVGGDGTTLNVEYSSSVTQPLGGFFATRDVFGRLSFRLAHPLVRTRKIDLHLGTTLDLEHEQNFLPDFDVALSRDRYLVMRANADLSVNARGGSYTASTTLSYGLPSGRGIDGFPSRAGATGNFLKIEGRVSATHRLPLGFVGAVVAQGQKLIAGGVPTTEIFSADGRDAVSGVVVGALASDEGFVGRGELRYPVQRGPLFVQPYAYAAAGHLYARIATPFDIGAVQGYGVGATATLALPRIPIAPFATVEYGHSQASGPYRFTNRISVTAGVHF